MRGPAPQTGLDDKGASWQGFGFWPSINQLWPVIVMKSSENLKVYDGVCLYTRHYTKRERKTIHLWPVIVQKGLRSSIECCKATTKVAGQAKNATEKS